jgi:hypothetical protein
LLAVCKLFEREQLESVAPGIGRVEAANARERVVPLHAFACGFEPTGETVELFGCKPKCGMRLPRRGEGVLDADVELSASREREPHAAAGAQWLGLFDLLEAEQRAEEAPRLGLAAGRSGELKVV